MITRKLLNRCWLALCVTCCAFSVAASAAGITFTGTVLGPDEAPVTGRRDAITERCRVIAGIAVTECGENQGRSGPVALLHIWLTDRLLDSTHAAKVR